MMGGAAPILARGRGLHDAGDYLLATEIVNKLVQAEPGNGEAKELLADIFEQLGYQQENPGPRNSFLAATYELRSGIPQGGTVDSPSPDVIRAMTTERLFENADGSVRRVFSHPRASLLPASIPILTGRIPCRDHENPSPALHRRISKQSLNCS